MATPSLAASKTMNPNLNGPFSWRNHLEILGVWVPLVGIARGGMGYFWYHLLYFIEQQLPLKFFSKTGNWEHPF